MELSHLAQWRSRGYMPHFDSPELTQHITFSLADSIPAHVLNGLRNEVDTESSGRSKREVELRKRIETLMDAGHGACLLRDPIHARSVESALLHFDGVRYRLTAWVVMPNHVHAMFQTIAPWTLAQVVGSWKSYTSKQILRNNAEPLRPPVWYREYWDRYIRNERHFSNALNYIHQNPVKAGLVSHASLWPWSSASHHASAG